MLVLLHFTAVAQEPKATTGTFLLKGGTLHTITNGTQEADLLIKDGNIQEIGTGLTAEDAVVIDCSGKHVYPGMIDGGTRIGLQEIGSVSETRDYSELGKITPHVKALTAVNPNSVHMAVNRVSGLTTALSLPAGGLFPGTAALIHLHGYTPQQMFAAFEGVVMNFPSIAKRGRWDSRSAEEIAKEAKKEMDRLNEAWEKASVYQDIDSAHRANSSNPKPDYYPEMAQLARVIEKDLPLLVEVNNANDILKAIEWVREKQIEYIFTGVEEGWRVADSLAKYEIPVITGPVLTTPSRSYDRYDAPYANAGKMAKAGVKVALRTMDTENARNLPFNAAFAAKYGMGKEEALKAVTINAAEILGIGSYAGSLEAGKWADLFIADGDPFETKTQIQEVFIAGWRMPIENRQTRLYQEFLERTPALKK